MRKTLLIIVLFLCAHNLFSQQDSLLKKFKYRIAHYQAVNLNAGAGTQFSQSEIPATTNKNRYLSGGLGGNYYLLKSTDKILLTASAGLGTALGTGKSDNDSVSQKNNSFNFVPSFSILNKWFSKKMFKELGAGASLQYATSKFNITGYQSPFKNKNADYSIAIHTGIGTGRLENIIDMQNALWLYKELTDEKIISRQLTGDELIELGRAITAGNNTRVLDTRRRTKFILATVDNYLQQKGVINKTDIKYFSSLNDILFFAFNNPRLSGTEKYIRFTPAIASWNRNEDASNAIDKFRHRFNTKSLLLSLGLGKYIPTDLVHQNNIGASAKLSYVSADLSDKYFTNDVITNEVKGKSELKQAAVNLFFQHSIYPNTRTAINFNLQIETGYQGFEKQTNFYNATNLTSSVDYFISYRTKFTAGVGAQYQKNVYDIYDYVRLNPNTLFLYANAGINISL
jgi:hypothetical protein